MSLNIKDPATERSVRELSALTGEGVTTAVRRAADERLSRLRRDRAGLSLSADLQEIGARCAALPDIETASAEDLIGYDAYGAPL